MKTTDLMVGDWVNMGNPIDDKLVPTKIENIYGEEINCKTGHTNEDVPTILSGKWLRYAQPIPLTEEILVKISDFTVRGEYVISGANRYPYARIAWSRDKEKFYFSTLGSNCYLDYVHQLQHLLRIVGIEKEISIV